MASDIKFVEKLQRRKWEFVVRARSGAEYAIIRESELRRLLRIAAKGPRRGEK